MAYRNKPVCLSWISLGAKTSSGYPQCLPRNRNELPEIQARVVPADGNSRSFTVSGKPDH